MSLAFVSITEGVVARSPMERQAARAGARFETRDGWSLAVAYERERPATGGWVDVSHLPKVELHGDPGVALQTGTARHLDRAWWCPLAPGHTLVIGAGAAGLTARGAWALDVTSSWAGLVLCGPPARETFARFTAIDVRERTLPIGGLRPGSVARTPGLILREADERFLMLFGWAVAEYMWTVVEDAARPLGGGPLGVGVLAGPLGAGDA